MKHVITMFLSTFTIIKLTAWSGPQWNLLTWKIKLRCQTAWDYLFYIRNIFIVGVIMPSIWNSWKSIETKWYLVPSSVDTKGFIFKRKFQFNQQIFHCSKNFEMAKSRESSFLFKSIKLFWVIKERNISSMFFFQQWISI